MKQYKISTDFNTILYVFLTILTILLAFSLFTVTVLFPVYWLSKNNPTAYSISALLLLAAVVLLFFVLRMVRIFKKYSSVSTLCLHMLVYYLIPPLIILFILFIEAVSFQVFFSLLPMAAAISAVIVVNSILVVGFLFLRRFYHFMKNFFFQKSNR
jgi:hypothetical protein